MQLLFVFCRIMYYHRHKTVVKDWFGNGLTTPVDGKIEFVQETEFSSTSIQMDLTGLQGEVGKFGIYSVGDFVYCIDFFSSRMFISRLL